MTAEVQNVCSCCYMIVIVVVPADAAVRILTVLLAVLQMLLSNSHKALVFEQTLDLEDVLPDLSVERLMCWQELQNWEMNVQSSSVHHLELEFLQLVSELMMLMLRCIGI